MAAPEPTETIPIYQYRVALADDTERTVSAMGYELDGPWMTFDDTTGTVLILRSEAVLSVERVEQVGEQTVDVIA